MAERKCNECIYCKLHKNYDVKNHKSIDFEFCVNVDAKPHTIKNVDEAVLCNYYDNKR